MALISLLNASLNYSGTALLDDATLHVEAGDRICVVGRNGVGKSSLLSILAGLTTPDAGHVVKVPGLRIGHVRQTVPEDWRGSVFDIVDASYGGHGEDWERHGEVMGVVNSLCLDADADFSTLSGGTRRRVALACALLSTDLLLLDEPTNHLDIDTIAWLEEYLLRKARTLIVVSHDRALLRRLSTRIVELDRGRLYVYDCGYDAYLARREERLATEEVQNAKFDRRLSEEEAWIRQGIKARRTRNMGRVRDLIALRAERATRRARLGSAVLRAQEAERSGRLVLEAKDLGYSWPDGRRVFSGANLIVQRGDKIGLIGRNGAGKTTLLRVLLGELAPTEGSLRTGTQLEIAYFDQLRNALDLDATLMDSIADGNDVVTIGNDRRHVAGYLRDFLFPPEKLRMSVRTLSGGERNRLLLAKLFTRPSNMLVLDEPTNDLDIETLELLEEMLAAYSGTIIIVSHDRAFLDELVTSTISLDGDGLVRENVGGYTDWLRQRATDAPRMKEPERRRNDLPARRKPSYREQREVEALRRELEELPGKMDDLDRAQRETEASLADPDLFARDRGAFDAATTRLPLIGEEQTALLERWEAIERRLRELGA